MKKSILFTGALLLGATFFACSSQKGMEKETMQSAVMSRTVPSQLESYNGDISFDYVVDFVPGEFQRNSVMKM